jgi:hypothetical protein
LSRSTFMSHSGQHSKDSGIGAARWPTAVHMEQMCVARRVRLAAPA